MYSSGTDDDSHPKSSLYVHILFIISYTACHTMNCCGVGIFRFEIKNEIYDFKNELNSDKIRKLVTFSTRVIRVFFLHLSGTQLTSYDKAYVLYGLVESVAIIKRGNTTNVS